MACPRLDPLAILGRKWSYLLLRALNKPMTFSELQRELTYVTNRVLSRELHYLSSEGLLQHHGDRYRRSTAGDALLVAAEPLAQWSVEHRKLTPCPPSQRCATCANYVNTVGAKKYLQLGK